MTLTSAPNQIGDSGSQTQNEISGADALMDSLRRHGVDTIFGYPGGAILPIYDAVFKAEQEGWLKHILVRHEQGGTHAADGFARATGKVGVCFGTSGPGATNLVTGIATAQMDSVPLVVITGQVPRPAIGTDAFQETDIFGITLPIVKHSWVVRDPSEIARVVAQAFLIASSGRPGPVLIDIPKDVGQEMFNYLPVEPGSIKPPGFELPFAPEHKAISAALDLIENAEQPLLYVGGGVISSGAHETLAAIANRFQIPVTTTLMGKGAFDEREPLSVGMLGMHGTAYANFAVTECDLLIAIGARFDDRVTGKLDTFAPKAKVIHFEIDPAEINKNVKVDIPLLGDCKESLRSLIPLIQKKSHDQWKDRFDELMKVEVKEVIDKDLYPQKEGLTMGEVIVSINKHTRGDAVLVTDVGQHQMVACRYTDFVRSRSNVTSGGLGTMGFALPAAIGAKMGAPEREVVAVIGDGGYQMTIQELGTIFQTQAAVKIVVLNNEFLGMVRQWQQLFFDKRYASTEMVNPDFITIAKGYYLDAKKVDKRENLDAAVAEMIASDKPYFLEVCVEKEDNVFPMIPTGASVSDIRLK